MTPTLKYIQIITYIFYSSSQYFRCIQVRYPDYTFGKLIGNYIIYTQQSSSGKDTTRFPNELQINSLQSNQATPINQPSLPNKLRPPKQIR